MMGLMGSQLLVVVAVVALWCICTVAHGSNDHHTGGNGNGMRYPDPEWQYGRSPAPRGKTEGSISYNGGSERWYTSSPGGSYRDYDNALLASRPSTYYNGGEHIDKNMYNNLYDRSGNSLPDREYYSRFENGYQDQLRSRFAGIGYGNYGAGYRQAGFYGSKSPPTGYDYFNQQAYRGSRIYDGTKTMNFSPQKQTGVYVIPTPAKLYYDGVKN